MVSIEKTTVLDPKRTLIGLVEEAASEVGFLGDLIGRIAASSASTDADRRRCEEMLRDLEFEIRKLRGRTYFL